MNEENKKEIVKITHNNRLRPFQSIEKEVFRKAIKFNEENVSKTAKDLEIGKTTIYRKLHKK
jgi:transcriptional regulator with PAS, ATPase and Fis domain